MFVSTPHGGNQRSNLILGELPPSETEALAPFLTHVSLPLGHVLQQRGTAVKTVFFLESGVASLMAETADGAQVEVGMTGREGFVGVSAFLSPGGCAVHHACMQAEGLAKCVAVPALQASLQGCEYRIMHPEHPQAMAAA